MIHFNNNGLWHRGNGCEKLSVVGCQGVAGAGCPGLSVGGCRSSLVEVWGVVMLSSTLITLINRRPLRTDTATTDNF